MATRKPRKFAEGGEADTGYDEETQARGTAELERIRDTQPSFKEAFAAARSAGDKTFEWNGKKFTTELAKPKAAPKAEAPKVKTLAPADKGETRRALPLKSTKSESGNKFMGSTGLKSGGSVKGWGKARGARKAKVY